MLPEEFEYVFEQQVKRSREVLVGKAKEYAVGGNRLHNFVQAAHLQQCTPVQAVGGFMAKHTVSIYDMIASDGDFTMEQWDEKITDHLNYLFLLKAAVVDAHAEKMTSLQLVLPLTDTPTAEQVAAKLAEGTAQPIIMNT